MEVTEALAKGIIAVFAAFLIGLGVVAFAKPGQVQRFLTGFAQNRSVHFLEMALHTIVGASFLACAASVPYESTFRLLGWILVCTTAVLVLIPWRLHRRFALLAVPRALEYTGVIGVSSIAMGVSLLFGLTSGGEI